MTGALIYTLAGLVFNFVSYILAGVMQDYSWNDWEHHAAGVSALACIVLGITAFIVALLYLIGVL